MSSEAKIACYQIACDSAVEDYVISRIRDESKAILLGDMKPKEWPSGVSMLEEFGLVEPVYPESCPFVWAFRRTELGKRVRDRLRDDQSNPHPCEDGAANAPCECKSYAETIREIQIAAARGQIEEVSWLAARALAHEEDAEDAA